MNEEEIRSTGTRRRLYAWLCLAVAALVGAGLFAVLVAMSRGRLQATLQETATLVLTGGANVAQIERPTTDNRFAYAPAIAVGTIVAALGF